MNPEEKILADLTMEDLPPNFKDFVKDLNIDIDLIKKMILYGGGDGYYIPSVAKFKTLMLERRLNEISGFVSSIDSRKLRREFHVCSRTINRLVKDHNTKYRRKKQIDLFGKDEK